MKSAEAASNLWRSLGCSETPCDRGHDPPDHFAASSFVTPRANDATRLARARSIHGLGSGSAPDHPVELSDDPSNLDQGRYASFERAATPLVLGIETLGVEQVQGLCDLYSGELLEFPPKSPKEISFSYMSAIASIDGVERPT